MRNVTVFVVSIIVLCLVTACHHSSTDSVNVRISDTTGAIDTVINVHDIDRSSVRVQAFDRKSGILSFALTKAGAEKFAYLTKKLAERGKVLNEKQSLELAINNVVYAKTAVDYTATPNGIVLSSGMPLTYEGLNLGTAEKLAVLIRGSEE